MIRIYPSRLDGQPLEVHQHGRTTLHDWLRSMTGGYTGQGDQPIQIDVNGVNVSSDLWFVTRIGPDSEVKIYPTPGADMGALEITYLVFTAVLTAYSVYTMLTMAKLGSSSDSANSLSLNPAKANQAKLGAPIREVMGRVRIYPDYLVQPVSRFVDLFTYQTKMYVCIGTGNFTISEGEIRVGSTPVAAFEDDVSYQIYGPGEDVSADDRTENWFNSTEVGSTNGGTSGLDTKTTANTEYEISADSITVSGNSLTFNNFQTTDDDDDADAGDLSDRWSVGEVVTIRASATYQISASGLYSVIAGNFVDELVPVVGMPVTMEYNGSDYTLFIASYTAGQAAVPGVGGSAASITGSAAVTTYDFSASAITFTLTWQGDPYIVSLDQNYVDIATLTTVISNQLSGSGLGASSLGSVLSITELASPYQGGSITYSLLPESVFGSAPTSVEGTTSTGGSAAVSPQITLAYDSATGTAFSGLPEGNVTLTLVYGTGEFKVLTIEGESATVQRLTTAGTEDDTWAGWTARTSLDFEATGFEDNTTYLGPFLACPDGETTDAIEVDFSMPNGIGRYSSKGKFKEITITIEVQYRAYNSGSEWVSVYYSYSGAHIDARGYTHTISLPSVAQYEVRARRITSMWGGSTREAVYWLGLRSRLADRPTSYAGVTTIALTINTGTKLAAQSDRRVSVVATREYDSGTPRTVSGALTHILTSAGIASGEIDSDTFSYLESTYWTPRSEFFDYAAEDDSTSVLDILQLAAQAGMGYFILNDGLCSAGREGIKSWSGSITPQDTTDVLTTSFKSPTDDDYDGVDVTYINPVTWTEEVIECRLSDDTPVKVESFTADGVLNADVAYRLGMRRLMKHQSQRLSYSTTTEMDLLVYNYGDVLVLTDDIPGSFTTSCLIDDANQSGGVLTLTVGEQLDWSIDSPRCLIRFQDGTLSALLTPTQVDQYTLTVPDAGLHFEDWEMQHPTIEPPKLIFCSSSQVGYQAIVSEIAPNSDGTVDLSAVEYSEDLYQYDDATAP